MNFGIERASIVYLTVTVPVVAAFAVRLWIALGRPTVSRLNARARLVALTVYGAAVGATAGVWAHALPCWKLRCDMSVRDDVELRVHILCFVGPLVGALAVARAASAPMATPPPLCEPTAGVPWIEGVRISHVPPRWAGPMPARGNLVMGTLP